MGNTKSTAYEPIEMPDAYLDRTETNVSFSEEIEAIRGNDRNITKWLPSTDPKAIVLICHGILEHSLRHSRVSYSLARRNYAVFGIDHIGHGLSPGIRGLIPDYKILVDDFTEFGNSVSSKYPTKPLFIYAHSMGTMVAVLASKAIPSVRAIVFSAIAFQAGKDSASPFGLQMLYPLSRTSFAKTLAGFLASIDPQGPAAPLLVSGLTSDEYELAFHNKDPRIVHGSVMNKTAFEFLKMVDVAKQTVNDFNLPFLCIHGTIDEVTLPQGSEYMFTNSATASDKKQLKLFEGLKHEMTNETLPRRDEVITTITTYIENTYNNSI